MPEQRYDIVEYDKMTGNARTCTYPTNITLDEARYHIEWAKTHVSDRYIHTMVLHGAGPDNNYF